MSTPERKKIQKYFKRYGAFFICLNHEAETCVCVCVLHLSEVEDDEANKVEFKVVVMDYFFSPLAFVEELLGTLSSDVWLVNNVRKCRDTIVVPSAIAA